MVQLCALKLIPCTVRCFIKFDVLPFLQTINLSHTLHRAVSSSLFLKYSQAFDGIFVCNSENRLTDKKSNGNFKDEFRVLCFRRSVKSDQFLTLLIG